MCRHLAFLGPAEPLGRLLVEPAHSLYRQSWSPRRQRYGTVNADGFGVGWYAEGDPVPARYRRAGPIWGDPSFADLARVVRSHAVLAAVRSATAPGPDGEAAAAPFTADRWLFSHNGAVAGWPWTAAPLVRTLPAADLLALEARCDAAFVWALLLDRLRRGVDAGRALADTVLEIDEAAPGSRLNLLLTDGDTITATTWGDTLWYLVGPAHGPQDLGSARPGGTPVVVASEPYDDDPRWREVPDLTLLAADRTEVRLTPLKDLRTDMASASPEEPST
ncbi:ergothioneine biosynthesis protein EgtC [Streptomyces sp. NPDC007264]|uniref:ergothioneine biosynthesis protein EgtC n=1 Tax=Streptomyces sp. NPDC007264 TaxID=3364777 RepID=UPI0036DC8584